MPLAIRVAWTEFRSCQLSLTDPFFLFEELGVRLVTSDRQVIESFPATAISPEDFLNLA